MAREFFWGLQLWGYFFGGGNEIIWLEILLHARTGNLWVIYITTRLLIFVLAVLITS